MILMSQKSIRAVRNRAMLRRLVCTWGGSIDTLVSNTQAQNIREFNFQQQNLKSSLVGNNTE